MSNVKAGGTTVGCLSLIDASAGGGSGDVARQDIVWSFMFPVYVNENRIRQDIIGSTLVNET